MKKYFVLLIMAVAMISFGQKKNSDKTSPKSEPATQTAPTQSNAAQATPPQQQVNPFINHYLVKFNVAMRFNDSDAAKDALYDLIVENPGNDSLFLNLAVMYYENQKYPSAILVSQELLVRNPQNSTAIEIAASSYEALNLYDKALQNYETLYLQTSNYATLYKMAFLQYDLKRFKECAATSDILLSKKEADELKVSYPTADNKTKEYPIKVAILNLKGMVAMEGGDNPVAKKLFEQALALAPDFVQAKENLSKLK